MKTHFLGQLAESFGSLGHVGERSFLYRGIALTALLLSADRSSMRGTLDRVSPELVLVDPRLSIEARAQLVAQDETLARLPSTAPKSELPPPLAWGTALESSADQHVRAALRRITELSEV